MALRASEHFEGAYFARHLEDARQQGRIGHVALDPILPVEAFFDIGGAGHNSDATAIWIAQFVGRKMDAAQAEALRLLQPVTLGWALFFNISFHLAIRAYDVALQLSDELLTRIERHGI